MARFQEHRDKHVQERWRLRRRCRPIDSPLVKYAYDQIAKYRLQKYHLWDKVGVNVDGAFKPDMVRNLQAQSEGHLCTGGKLEWVPVIKWTTYMDNT